MVILSPQERIIIPLDVMTTIDAEDIIDKLRGKVGAFKIGLEAINSGVALEIAESLISAGEKVFWDGKWSDIPNTCAGAIKGLRNGLGYHVWAVNVHANSGIKSVQAVVENKGQSLVLGVTLLTSIDRQGSLDLYAADPIDSVMRMVDVAVLGHVDGLICSPQEVRIVRSYVEGAGYNLIYVTPGVRPIWSVTGDQARPTTPKEAIMNGATYLVIGRPITAAENPSEAVERIVEEIESGLAER